jgi:biopolymer transport protein ExbD
MSMHAAPLSSSTATPELMMDMNMTPLIDVMLVLIIMLIITIPKQNHAVNLHFGSSAQQTAPREVVTIDIDFDGTVLWNGLAVDTRAALETRLAAVAASAAPMEVHLRPNRLAAYKTVAGVMASAQRLGVVNIGVIGNEQLM